MPQNHRFLNGRSFSDVDDNAKEARNMFCYSLAVSSTSGPGLLPLHLELNSSIVSTGKSSSFAFRTRDENGTLLVAGSLTQDYVSVSLNRGLIMLTTSLGSGMFLHFTMFPIVICILLF